MKHRPVSLWRLYHCLPTLKLTGHLYRYVGLDLSGSYRPILSTAQLNASLFSLRYKFRNRHFDLFRLSLICKLLKQLLHLPSFLCREQGEK